jgi:hypothetical protein
MHVTYSLNKELDKNIALSFLGVSAGGLDFTKSVIGPHPELDPILSLDEPGKKQLISTHFDTFYTLRADELQQALDQSSKLWSNVEEPFFSFALNLFGNKISPKKYTGFISIVNCNPRFVEDNSFQFFWKHRWGSTFISMHEILHFFFFDYTRTVIGEPYVSLDPNQGRYWEVSEAFNDIILAERELVGLHAVEKIDPYPSLAPFVEEGRKIWEDSRNIDVLIHSLYTWKT